MIKENTWKDLVIQLRTIAEKKGITQNDISVKTGMTQANISRIFSLKYIPKLSTVILIANALEVSIVIEVG